MGQSQLKPVGFFKALFVGWSFFILDNGLSHIYIFPPCILVWLAQKDITVYYLSQKRPLKQLCDPLYIKNKGYPRVPFVEARSAFLMTTYAHSFCSSLSSLLPIFSEMSSTVGVCWLVTWDSTSLNQKSIIHTEDYSSNKHSSVVRQWKVGRFISHFTICSVFHQHMTKLTISDLQCKCSHYS